MNQVLVTTSWDDGHLLDIRLASLLKKYDIKGTFYIAPRNRELPPDTRLSNVQIKELSQWFEIGAHTMTHPRLTTLSDQEAEKEIRDSKLYLEEVVGRPVTSFCYPQGYYTSVHMKLVQEADFALARTVRRFAMQVGDSPYALPTTLHTYRHWSDAVPILRAVGWKKFLSCYFSWEVLAKELFDQCLVRGGVFHLWGHSWETDRRGDWQRLERVLQYIANRPGVTYITNRELL